MTLIQRAAILFLFAISLFCAAPGHAAQMTLSDLNDICSGKAEASATACRFYILGVTEGASLGAGVGGDTKHFCIPEGVSSTEMVLIVKRMMVQDLAAYPKDKDMPAVSFIGAAMMQNFPCKKPS